MTFFHFIVSSVGVDVVVYDVVVSADVILLGVVLEVVVVFVVCNCCFYGNYVY